jgi:hypothetical protein
VEQATRIRYYDASARKKAPARARNMHSEFLRTGRILRYEERWLPDEKRYMTHDEVADRTGRKLETAGYKTHSHLNNFHRSIQFPSMIFHKTLEDSPHLGYCHVTASKTSFDMRRQILWSFYFANFFAEIGGDKDGFFVEIDPRYSRMYFAIAMNAVNGHSVEIDRSVHKDGLLFRTHDPKVALKNVLTLGARTEEMRKLIMAM